MEVKTDGVSIIICCYNSASRLPETLKHIGKQEVPSSIPWELIIVNNCSTDNTEEVAIKESEKCGIKNIFSIINQPIPGLSAARKLGIEKSKYEFILFCDDDNWLDKNYIQNSYEILSKNPEIGALGGLGTPYCQSEPPVWFNDIVVAYSVGKQNETDGDISEKKGFVFGAGMVIRRTAYDYIFRHGFKSMLSDRKGNSLTAGGDVELSFALRMAGYKIWYSEKLKFTHFIPKERLTDLYLKKLYIGIGITQVYLDLYLDILNSDNTENSLKSSWVNLLFNQCIKLAKELTLNTIKSNNIWHKVSCYYYFGFIKTLAIENSNTQKIKIEIINLKRRLEKGIK